MNLHCVAYPDFSTAAKGAMHFLQKRLGFRLWMLTRTESEDWVVLEAIDKHYGVKAGTLLRWSDSFCSQMVQGRGPCVAPRAMDVPAYATAPIARQFPIGAYIGVPLEREDGSLFGTLCAVDPEPKLESITRELPAVEVMGRMLSTMIVQDQRLIGEMRATERAKTASMRDPLTGVYDSHAWMILSSAEESRALRHGKDLSVVTVLLHGGDDEIRLAARAVKNAARKEDIVARTGVSELAILMVEESVDAAEKMPFRLHEALEDAGVHASFGVAAVTTRTCVNSAIEQARRAAATMQASVVASLIANRVDAA